MIEIACGRGVRFFDFYRDSDVIYKLTLKVKLTTDYNKKTRRTKMASSLVPSPCSSFHIKDCNTLAISVNDASEKIKMTQVKKSK